MTNNDAQDINCHPSSLTGTAFPYTAYLGITPPGNCDSRFDWGYTVTGYHTGMATWESNFYAFYGTLQCRVEAFIPDNHAGTYNAQYFIYDGSTYLANDAFVNQNASTNWVNIYGTGYLPIHDHMVVTLDDQDPMQGGSGQTIAAYALRFSCHY